MMAYEHTHPRTGQSRLAEQNVVRTSRPSSKFSSIVSRTSFVAVAATTMIIGANHASAAHSKSTANQIPHRPIRHSQPREGSITGRILSSTRGGGGSDQELRDEDLDEYIDFLLAYADDKATEADNPLFSRKEANHAEEEENEEDFVVEPLVDNVNDDTQLDAMVETLIASVDDEEIENDGELENIQEDTIIIEVKTEEAVQDIELAATSSLAEEVENAREISAESVAEETSAEIAEGSIELAATSSLVEERESVQEVSAESVAEEMSAAIVEEDNDLATTSSLVEERESIQEVSEEFVLEEISATIVEEDNELATTSLVEELDSVEDVSKEFVVEEISAAIVEGNIELATTPTLVEELDSVEEVSSEFEPEAISAAIMEEDIELATTSSLVEEAESIEVLSIEPETDELPVTMVEDDVVSAFEKKDSHEVGNTLVVDDTLSNETETAVDDAMIEINAEDTTLEEPVVELVDGEEKDPSQSLDYQEIVEEKESESFYLGSSAVENMPVPLNEDQVSLIVPLTDETTASTKRVPLFTSMMQKMGLKKEEPDPADHIPVDLTEQDEETPNSSKDAEERNTLISKSDSQLPISQENDFTEVITEVVLDSNDMGEEPTITVNELGGERSVFEHVDVLEQVEDAEDEANSGAEMTETGEPVILTPVEERIDDKMVTGVASVARQYYQDTWGSVKSFWSRKRWLRKESEDSPMERDYTKIYQKYYADQQALFIDDHSSREKHSRLSSAFLRPWGAKYSKPKESARTESVESSTAEYYSIGIQGFVEDDEVSDTPSQVEVDGGGGDEIETDTEESFEIDISNREEVDIKRAHTSMEDLELQFDDDATADANEGDVGGVKEIENDIEETELQVDGGINIVDAEDLEEGENGVIPVSIESLELQVDDDAIIDEEEVDVEEADEVEIDIEDTNIQGDIEIVIPDLEEERENAGIPASIEGLVLQVGDDVTVDEEVDVEEVDVIETNIEDIGIQFDGDIDIADMEEEENAGIHTSMEDLELKVAEDITLDDDAEEVDREDILQEAETPQVSEGTESDLVFVIESTEEEVDSKDIPIPIETDESTDYIESTSVEGPRPRKFFKRLWGTGKDISQIDSVVGFDNEEDQVEIKGTDTENEPSTDVEEIRPGEGSDRPNFFKRIWGANKELNEIYSLGLQGIKDLDSPTEEGSEVICDEGIVFISESETEETTEDVLEEFDVDISVSIGSSDQVEESLDVDTFDISESSGVEESEDERDISEPKNLNGENLEDLDLEEITSPEEGRYDRNVLQLHIPESAEIKEQIIHTSIEVTSESGSSKDLNTSETMYRLELCREDCDGLTPEDVDNEENIAIVKQENSLADIDVSVDNVIDEASNELESAYDVNDIKDALFEEEESQEEDIEGSMFAEGIEDLTTEEEEDSIEEDQEEDIEGSVVVEVIEDVLSEEEEDPIEEEDQEEDTENSVIAEVFEDLFSEEEDTEEDQEEDIEGSVVAEVIEDVFSETEEYFTEGEEQEDGAYDDISSHYSLELEMESANFLTKFLVNRGLEQLIMIAILIMEWFRMYIIAPFFESIDWIKEGKGQDLLQTVLNARGGALASSVSDSEDVDQMHNSEEDTSEDTEALGRGEPTSLCDDEGRSDGSMEIEKEGAEQVESAESEKLISTSVPTDISVPASPRVPPNFIFRRLLNYGVIGHILIMEMIVVSEWIQVYVPQIPSLAGYIVYDMLKYKRQSSREREEPVNKRNSGFINIGEGSRLGRKPKKLRKKEDQNALDQLKRIGDVNQAKYRFLSQKFMERHALGPYSATISEIELDLEAVETDLASKNNQINEEVEAESDSGWILDALGVEEEEDIAPSKSPFDTNVGVSLCSSDPKVSVGIEFSLGRKKSTKTSSQKLRNVFDNDIMASKNKIKTPKPHVSDIESGVMGRIRAAGANSLVGRSILGAYPGDLPPPDEAASPKGVINLARRYGYGDWSDDDDGDGYGDLFDEDENNDDDDTSLDYYSDEEYQSRPKQRSSTRTIKKKKTRKRRSSSSQQQGSAGVSVEFGFGGSSKSNKTPALSSATRKRRKSPSSLSSSGAESILSSSARRRKSRGSRLPSLPMEKLGETYASSTITTNRTKLANTSTNFKDGLDSITSRTIQRKRKSSTLRPAGVLLDEAKKAAQSSKED